MTGPEPRVAVVVCCYTEQRWDDLVAALHSVDIQTRPADDLVVVVDHAPGLAARLRRTFPTRTIIENRATQGLSGARNTGVAETDADIVAFLDDDAVAAPDWLEQLCAPYADPDVMAVGGRVDPQWDERRPRWFPREFDWVVGCTYAGHAPEGPIRNVIGANMSFRRSLVEEIGGFDERVGRVGTHPAGCEETELCIRIRQRRRGAVVWYAPAAMVAHRVRPERATFSYFRARCRAEGGSKARVAAMVGADDGLSSERSYALSTLPRATLLDVRSTVGSGDVAALGRSLARGSGMALAGVGYVTTKATARRRTSILAPTPDFRPAIVATAELGSSAAPVAVTGSDAGGYSRALVLVKDRDRPAGVVELALDERGLGAPDIAMQLRSGVGPDDTVWVQPVVSTPPDPDPADQHVTVVVATLGLPAVLRRCLESILASDYPSFDVLVVDNTADSESAGEVVAAFGPAVRWVREPQPGLANAHNRALLESTGAVLAFTDDDVVVDPTWIRTLVAAFEAAPDVVCVTGMIFPMELETPAQELVERSIGYGKGFDRQLHRLRPSTDDSPLFPYTAGRFGSGANMAFRADWLRRGGGFDPALGTGTVARGGDDLAAFYRTVAAGAALVYEPAAIVYHAHRREETALPRQSFGYGAGLTAYLTSVVTERPGRAGDIVRRVVPGVRYAFGKKSARNAGRTGDYPRTLRLREVAGMAAGPFLYLRSRRQNPAAGPFPTVPVIEAGREAVRDTVNVVAPARRVPILLYHSVCEDPAPLLRDWAVTPFQFREHLQRLGDAGYATLTVTDYVDRLTAGTALPDRFVVITFDDGFADFERHAAPALADAAMSATLYVSTAYVGGRSTWLGPDGEQPMLSWDAIRDLDAAGIEMGPHSHHHWALDELEPAQAANEITRSKQVLEHELGHPAPSFAYPHGYHTRRIQDVLRANGFRSACGVKHASSSTDDDVFGLARIIVPPEASGGDLLALMDELPVAPAHPRLRTGAWRVVRRTRARRRTRPDAVHEHPS